MKKQKWIGLACDGFLLAGLAVFVYGLSLAWRPAAFIVGGLILSAAAFFFRYGQYVPRSKR